MRLQMYCVLYSSNHPCISDALLDFVNRHLVVQNQNSEDGIAEWLIGKEGNMTAVVGE